LSYLNRMAERSMTARVDSELEDPTLARVAA
jgi:hypothetical protein